MVFKSPYPLTVPDIDYLTYLFTSKIFSPNEKVWIEANTPTNYITQSRAIELTQHIGAGLQSLGIRRPSNETAERDIILLISENQVMTPVTMFGIINAGAIVSTIPPQASSFEIAKQIGSTKAKLIICSPGILSTARDGVEKSILKGMPIAVMNSAEGKQELKLVNGKSLISSEKLEIERITDRNALEKRVILLGFSSGTTGVPKGVQLTHRNVVAQIRQWEHHFLPFHKSLKSKGLQTSLPGVLPTSHAGGITVHISLPLRIGLQIHMLPRFDLHHMLNVIEKYQLTCIFHSPPVFLLFTQPGFPREKLKSVWYAMSGAAPLSKELQQKVSKVLYNGTTLATNWGMTETVAVAAMYPATNKETEGSVGTLMPGLEAKVVDTISGKELGVGERGELLIKGPSITRGYYKNPEANAVALNGEWLHTGDIAIIDDKGRIFIVDRLKELIKYKGNQVAPAELEGLLLTHPGIADCAVIAYPGEEGNELPRAYVVKKDPALKAQEVVDWIRERVNPYKRLRGGVVFIDVIPKSPSGKILRRELKELALKEFKAKL